MRGGELYNSQKLTTLLDLKKFLLALASGNLLLRLSGYCVCIEGNETQTQTGVTTMLALIAALIALFALAMFVGSFLGAQQPRVPTDKVSRMLRHQKGFKAYGRF
jgi:uncharacterized protein HemY